MSVGLRLIRARWEKSELALFIVLPATVVAFSMGSSSVTEAVTIGRPLRWALLMVLTVVAAFYGWSSRIRLSRAMVAIVGGLGVLGVLSGIWSVTPRSTVERAISFLLLTAVAALVGAGSVGSHERRQRVLLALVIGPVIVALAGLVVLAFDHGLAVQGGTPQQPARLRGFGENPNTESMLLAAGLPVAIWFFAAARTTRARLTALAAAVLLYGEVVESGSRGAMLASAAGAIVFAIVYVRRVRVLVPICVVLIAVFGASFKIGGQRPSLAQTAPPVAPVAPVGHTPASGSGSGGTSGTQAPSSRFSVGTIPGSSVPIPFVPEQDEIGFPGLYQYKPILAYGSGRVYVWLSAIKQGLERPIDGYGFGTESSVFVDRSYIFQGSFTENSFVGMFLDLGILGTLLLLAPFAYVARVTVREVISRSENDRDLIAVGAAVCAGGFVIAFFESYLYSVGNVATLTFWVALFLVASDRTFRTRGQST